MLHEHVREHALDHLRTARMLVGEPRSFLDYLIDMAIAEAEGRIPPDPAPASRDLNIVAAGILLHMKEE